MLADHPILFDGEAVPWPQSWGEDTAPVENIFHTEAGTDHVILVRRRKSTIAWTSHADSRLKARYEAYRDKDSVAVSIWAAAAGAYRVITCRIRGWRAEMAPHSEKTAGTDGLWVINFTLEEF